MKSILTSFLLIFSVSLLAQKAYIQVEAEPGISVFLDGSFKGKTSMEMGGLIIEDVSSGTCTIKVVKEGFNPQEERITIKPGEVYTYKVRPFVPGLKISQTGNTGQQQIDLKVGRLKIQSLPISIIISISSLGVNSSKSKDEWTADEVPVGTYTATFRGMNKTLSGSFEIKHDQLTHLFVNMVRGEIENRSIPTGIQSNNEGMNYSDPNLQYTSFRDERDGKTYKTIRIGSQVWMAENLAYLPAVSLPSAGSKIEPHYYVYECAETNVAAAKAHPNYTKYGVLYNWPAALKACPVGWHLPSDVEWTQLENYLIANGYNYDGTTFGKKIAKSMATTSGWNTNPGTGTVGNTDYPAYRNKCGFSGLPGGYRYGDGNFNLIGGFGYWWSSTVTSPDRAWTRTLAYDYARVYRYYDYKDYGFSVRCLRD